MFNPTAKARLLSPTALEQLPWGWSPCSPYTQPQPQPCPASTTTTTQPRLCCHGSPKSTGTAHFSCLLSLLNQFNFKTYLMAPEKFSSGGTGNCEAGAVPNVLEVKTKSLQHRSKVGADVLSGDLQSGRGTFKKLLLSSYTRVMWGHRITGYSELEGTHEDHRVQTKMAELPLLQELH